MRKFSSHKGQVLTLKRSGIEASLGLQGGDTTVLYSGVGNQCYVDRGIVVKKPNTFAQLPRYFSLMEPRKR